MVPAGCPHTSSFQFLIVSMCTSFLCGRSWGSQNSAMCLFVAILGISSLWFAIRRPQFFTHMDLHDSQAEHRREWKREQYRRMLPLFAHKRIMAVTIWWEAGKLVCMALRYLGTEYLATWERCRISDDVLAGVSAHGVVHPNVVPEQWRAFCWKALQP